MCLRRVNSSCYGLSLKTATTYGGMFFPFIDKGIAYLIPYHDGWYPKDESSTVLIFIYLVIFIALITTILMIIGSALNKYKLIYPFLALDFPVTTLIIWYGTYKLLQDSEYSGLMALYLGIIAIAFEVHYWMVVYSRFMEICSESEERQALLGAPIISTGST